MAEKRTVTLVMLAKTESGWKRLAPALDARKKIRQGYGVLESKPHLFPDGSYRYQLRWIENRQPVYENAGTSAIDAVAVRDMKEKRLSALDTAADAGVRVVEEPGRLYIRKQAQRFIEDAKQRGALEAAEVNRLTLDEFIATTSKTYVDEIGRQDVLDFHSVLRKRGLSDRTVSNKHARLRSFLLYSGVDVKKAMPPKPKFESKLPQTYSAGDITAILKAADEDLKLVINVALKTGLREQELIHLEWPDVDFEDSVIRVRSKPRYGFKIKDAEERDVPIPDDLLTLLRKAEKGSDGKLVFPSPKGNPHSHLLRLLKRAARDGGLNCGHCEGCKGHLGECQKWQLHQFRRTYCTSLLRSGVDLATAQAFMGHADLASTMRYLRPASASETQKKINSVKWG